MFGTKIWRTIAIFGAGAAVGVLAGVWIAEGMIAAVAGQAVEANLLNARRAASAGNLMEQLRSSASVLAYDPGNPSALLLLGDLFAKPTSRNLALEAYREALRTIEEQARNVSTPQARSRLESDAKLLRERLRELGEQ